MAARLKTVAEYQCNGLGCSAHATVAEREGHTYPKPLGWLTLTWDESPSQRHELHFCSPDCLKAVIDANAIIYQSPTP